MKKYHSLVSGSKKRFNEEQDELFSLVKKRVGKKIPLVVKSVLTSEGRV